MHTSAYSDILAHSSHKVAFEQALWDEIKESGDHITTMTGFSTVRSLLEILIEQYRAHLPNGDLVERGMVIFFALLRVRGNQSIEFLKASNVDTQNFIKNIVEQLFLSPKFREQRKHWNLATLSGILDMLPTLNEASQKYCVPLFSDRLSLVRTWISRYPSFYNEMLTTFVERPRVFDRITKVKFIAHNCPGADVSKIQEAMQSIAPLSQEEICCISSTQTKFLECLQREPTDKEKSLMEYSNYRVIPDHMERARPFVEKAPCRQASSDSFLDLGPLLKWVDFINMDNSKLLNYLNPSFLVIKLERIEPNIFKENITKLANVLQNRIKITGAPEDDAEREKIYAECHLYLAHISHLLSQREIQKCSGFLLACAEIGANCFKQYPEIPALYHTLIGEMDVPLVPSWVYLNDVEIPLLPGSFNEILTSQLKKMVTEIERKQVAFNEPMDSTEIDYVYHVLKQKMHVILYLVNQLNASSVLPCALEKLNTMNRQSPMKLIEEMRSMENRLSLAWMISYMKMCSLNDGRFTAWINGLVKEELEGKTAPNSNTLKKILCGFYGLQDGSIQDAMQKIIGLMERPENLSEGLIAVYQTVAMKTIFHETRHLGDKLFVMLHHYRWNLFYDELAILPKALTHNIHNEKFLESEIATTMKLYHASSSQSHYEDRFVFQEARDVLYEVNDKISFKYLVSPALILTRVKEALFNKNPNNKIDMDELTDWFKINLPQEMTLEQVQDDLFDENYKIKDKWLIYLLEKTGIIQKT